MPLNDQLQKNLATAMKSRDKNAVTAIRMLKTSIIKFERACVAKQAT